MPSSSPFAITPIIDQVMKLNPRSILDLGVGFGKWGALFREYLDIWHWRLYPDEWDIIIVGVEGDSRLINPLSKFVYTDIIESKIEMLDWDELQSFDLICMFDVIEHLPKPLGFEVLRKAWKHATKSLFVTTPTPEDFAFSKHGRWADDLGGHKARWSPEDFELFDAEIFVFDGGQRGLRTFLARMDKPSD